MICKIVIALISFVCLASGEIFDIGPCPAYQRPDSLEMGKLYGKWYEIARVDNTLVSGETCVTFNISSEASYLTGHPVTIKGHDEKNGKLEYIYIANLEAWDDRFDFEYGDLPLVVTIDTDYDNYAIILGCGEIPPFGYWFPFLAVRVRVAWILSRTPTIDANLQLKLVESLAAKGIGQSKLTFTESADCPANY